MTIKVKVTVNFLFNLFYVQGTCTGYRDADCLNGIYEHFYEKDDANNCNFLKDVNIQEGSCLGTIAGTFSNFQVTVQILGGETTVNAGIISAGHEVLEISDPITYSCASPYFPDVDENGKRTRVFELMGYESASDCSVDTNKQVVASHTIEWTVE